MARSRTLGMVSEDECGRDSPGTAVGLQFGLNTRAKMVMRAPLGSLGPKNLIAARSALKRGSTGPFLNAGSQKKVKMPSIAETEEQTEYGGHSHIPETQKKAFGN
jgi:hypothetical protein